MFAVVVRLELSEGPTIEQARQMLETQVIPMVKQSPGFAAGFWLAPAGHDGLSFLIYEDEQSARAMAGSLHSRPQAKLLSVEVREVVASA
ncbi:MAG: hypothetical protein JWM18_4760 [Chloroflexi bacterium]|jgi:hypothetical protein|nr:hypothetical protein [Chloroflexota bacterium]